MKYTTLEDLEFNLAELEMINGKAKYEINELPDQTKPKEDIPKDDTPKTHYE